MATRQELEWVIKVGREYFCGGPGPLWSTKLADSMGFKTLGAAEIAAAPFVCYCGDPDGCTDKVRIARRKDWRPKPR